jgi:hypothetical protein
MKELTLDASDPGACECWTLTMVGHPNSAYWPEDARGRPTGHHPLCELYQPPPAGHSLAEQLQNLKA